MKREMNYSLVVTIALLIFSWQATNAHGTSNSVPSVPASGVLNESFSSVPTLKGWKSVGVSKETGHQAVKLQTLFVNPMNLTIYVSGELRNRQDSNVWVRIDKMKNHASHPLNWIYPVQVNGKGRFAAWLHLPFGKGSYEVEVAPPLTTDETSLTYLYDTKEESKSLPFRILYRYSDSNQQLGLLTSVWANGSDPSIAKLAVHITRNAKTPLEKAIAVYQWEAKHIGYDWANVSQTTAYRWSTAEEAIRSRKGVCVDYCNIADALMRSLGIPTQMLVGYANDSNVTVADNGNLEHSWNRSWIDGKWVYWDPTWSRLYLISTSDYILQTNWFNPPMAIWDQTHHLKYIAMQ